MPDMRSWFSGNESKTSVPGAPGRQDPAAYIRALIASEDAWRRQRFAAARQATQPGASVGAAPSLPAYAPERSSPSAHSSMAASLVQGDPMFVTYGTGFNDNGFARFTSQGPGAAFAGYRMGSGGRPQGAGMAGSGSSGASLDANPNDPFERQLALARAKQAVGY